MARLVIKSMVVLVLLASMSGSVFAQGNYPIYGIHFFSDSVSQGSLQIQNGRPMWTVELLYTQDTHNWDDYRWQQERSKFQNIRNKNFRIILRVDRSWQLSIPAKNDWEGRYYFAMDCKKIAQKLGDLLEAMIIGNEFVTSSDPDYPYTGEWYATVFNAGDDNCVYQQVKSVSNVKVGIYAPGGWPGSENLDFWDKVVNNVRKDANNKPQIDCFPLHAYSGASTIYDTNAEDPRFGDECDFRGFVPYMRRIYSIFGATKPVYITETNTQWYYGQWATDQRFSQDSYRSCWLKEAFQAIDEWNWGNDLKVCAFCWFVWQYQCVDGCDQHQNALCRTDNWRLNEARSDYYWVTANKWMVPGNPGSNIRIQAENYRNSNTDYGRGTTNGVSGVDYYDTTSGNIMNFFRHEDVDVYVDPYYTTVFVGWTAPGEWLKYESLFGGYNYKLKFRFSRGISGSSKVRLQVDGVTKWTMYLDDPDDNWDTYHESGLGSSVYIAPGDHILTLIFDQGSVNIDWFELVRQ
jgi:hypothetical protein